MIKCMVVEDEPLAIAKLVKFISKVPFLKLEGTYNSALKGMTALEEKSVDLIFLDIEMQSRSGIQFIESMEVEAKIIVTTAYEKYALKGFELDVTDYLLKPIPFHRFLTACIRVQEQLLNTGSKDERTKIFIKTEYRLEGVDISSILYVEGMGDYCRVVTQEKSIMTLQALKELQRELPWSKFDRVHHSYLVAIDKIDRIQRNRITIGDKQIPISLSNTKRFLQKIGR